MRPFGVQDENVDGLEPAKRLDGRGAGVAGGRPDHRRARALAHERAVHQPRHHLHGEVLEGQRRPVKQLEDEAVRRDLPQRRDGRVMEAAIGLGQHGLQVRQARIAFEERPHHAIGGIGIIEAGEPGDRVRLELGPGLRHEQAAVARERGKQRAFKGKRRRFAPR